MPSSVTLIPNPMFGEGSASSTDDSTATSRSAVNALYDDSTAAASISAQRSGQTGLQIDNHIQEQRASRQILGIGIMSAVGLLLAIIAIATNGSNTQDQFVLREPSPTAESPGASQDPGPSSTNQGLLDRIATLEMRLDLQATLIVSCLS